MEKEITIDAMKDNTPLHYKEFNQLVHKAIEDGYEKIKLINVYGQRFIAAGVEKKVQIDIYGTPGNDLGIFMDGPTINVYGNAEDHTGNTMNSGKIVIHGHAWDVTGLAARGGSIFIKQDSGYRVGIHMKEYKSTKPILVVGGRAKEFFGEYMAGGILVALGLEINGKAASNMENIVQGSLGSGMHGGVIYIRGKVNPKCLGVGATIVDFAEDDKKVLKPIISEFCKNFDVSEELVWETEFTKIVPGSARPFAGFYTGKAI